MCQIHVRCWKVLLACSALLYYRGARCRAFPSLWVQCIPFQTYLKHTRNLWPQYGRYDTFPTLESLFLIDTYEVRILTQTREAMRQIAPQISTAYAVLGLGGTYETRISRRMYEVPRPSQGLFFYP